MSNSAAVRFPDGTVRYGVYDPTEESIWPPLFATIDDAKAAWSRRRTGAVEPTENEGQPSSVEVRIFADFDGGFWWIGEATEATVTLGITWAGMIGTVDDVEWDDEPRTRHRDVPDWAREALDLPEPTND
ncbi:MAG TPA: hypothetical protein VHZ02_02080 [Acidimicrobiales bacterium]|nr:hypothetical protein [Acidimicrobiales bacterium]